MGAGDAALTFEDLAKVPLADLPHKRDPVVADGPLSQEPSKTMICFLQFYYFWEIALPERLVRQQLRRLV